MLADQKQIITSTGQWGAGFGCVCCVARARDRTGELMVHVRPHVLGQQHVTYRGGHRGGKPRQTHGREDRRNDVPTREHTGGRDAVWNERTQLFQIGLHGDGRKNGGLEKFSGVLNGVVFDGGVVAGRDIVCGHTERDQQPAHFATLVGRVGTRQITIGRCKQRIHFLPHHRLDT